MAPGSGQIRVNVLTREGPGTSAAQDDVFLTVGRTDENSELDIDLPTVGRAARVADSDAPPPGAPALDPALADSEFSGPAPVDSEGGAPASPAPSAPGPGQACAAGGWQYVDPADVTRPQKNYGVEVWDDDSGDDDLLTSGLTGLDGNYELCFNAGDDDEGGQVDPYVVSVSENSLWRVQNQTLFGSPYRVSSSAVNDLATETTHNFGTLQPQDSALIRGMHAFDSANDAWLWTPKTGPEDCWDKFDTTCRQVKITWTPTSTSGAFYQPSSMTIHLKADDPNSHHLTVHEIGHAVMADVYEDDYPPTSNCSPHYVDKTSGPGCAWTEGFAEWYPAMVYNDPFYRWPDGGSLNLETPTWGSSDWDEGDSVEGRIAGALIDMSDADNEGSWDRMSEGAPGNIWNTFASHVSDNMTQFMNHRVADGYDTSQATFKAVLFGNTIDYSFRDPLTGTPASRPTPLVPHNFKFETSSTNWSAVALKRTAGDSFWVKLFDDSSLSSQLANAVGGDTLDFVAVDSNRRALGDYYPQVRRCLTCIDSNTYSLQVAQGSSTLSEGTQSIPMGSSDIVAVRDVLLTAGVPVHFQVNTTNIEQDPLVFLMNAAGSQIKTRAQASVSSVSGGTGVAEAFSFTPTTTGSHGFILLNGSGSGNYEVLMDMAKIPTTTTVNANVEKKTVVASGMVTPPSSEDRVTLVLQKRKPSRLWKKVYTKNPKMNTAGDFTATFDRPDGAGRYRFKAHFPGNVDFLGSKAIKAFNL